MTVSPILSLDSFFAAPITEERPWVVFAACRDADPDIFFPSTAAQEAAAKAVCATCPVSGECRAYADEAREYFGVWGGAGEKQRRIALRRSA